MEASKFYCKECGTEVTVSSFKEILDRKKLCDECNKPALARDTKKYSGIKKKRLERTKVKRLEQSRQDYNKKYNAGSFVDDDSD